MKNTFKFSLFSLITVFLMSSFSLKPVAVETPYNNDGISTTAPYGGAYLLFAGKFGGEIKKNELTGQKELKVDGCARGSQIISYTLEVTKNGTMSRMNARNNVLSDEMVSRLQSLSPGDSFEFKEIRAYLPNGKDIVDVHGKKFIVV